MRFPPTRSARPLNTHYGIAAFVPALIVVLSISGFVWAQKTVNMVVDGRTRHATTQASSVGDLLREQGIVVGGGDIVSPAPATGVAAGMTVVVRHAVPVLIAGSGSRVPLRVVGNTVADALVAAGMDPANLPAVKPSLSTRLRPGMVIDAPELFVRVVQQFATVPAGKVVRRDASLPTGSQSVTPGHAGKELRVYRRLVVAGVEGTPTLSAEAVLVSPQPTVVLVGCGSGTVPAAPDGRPITLPAPPTGGSRMHVLATAYSAEEPGSSSGTATGRPARYGVCAVDPGVIPLGSRLYIPGYGYAIAADTGRLIKGNHIDLCFDSLEQMNRWGSRHVTIIICK